MELNYRLLNIENNINNVSKEFTYLDINQLDENKYYDIIFSKKIKTPRGAIIMLMLENNIVICLPKKYNILHNYQVNSLINHKLMWDGTSLNCKKKIFLAFKPSHKTQFLFPNYAKSESTENPFEKCKDWTVENSS